MTLMTPPPSAQTGTPVKPPSDTPRVDAPVIVIEPRPGWRSLDLKELWAFRSLLRVLAERDIKVRYKQTVLGFAWAILQPVATMIVFTIFFGNLARIPSDGVPYPIFAYAALLPWTLFASALAASSMSLVASSQLISKVYLPRLIIPLASVGSACIDFLIASTILVVLMVAYGVGWSWQLLLAPPLAAAILIAALGIGIILAALTAEFRDFRHAVPFLVQIWMFATPVAYPASIVPAEWRWLYFLNPMAGLIDGFRAAVLAQPMNEYALAYAVVVTIALLLIGIAYFERVQSGLADVI